MLLLVIVGSRITIDDRRASKDEVCAAEDVMSDSSRSPFGSAASSDSLVHRPQRGVFAEAGGPPSFGQDGLQPLVAGTRLSTLRLPALW